jgi:sporulation protein YlmC with PRC-barrel domain
MTRIFLPLICAALGFAAASCSQSEGPFAPAAAPASPRATPHDTALAAMSPASAPKPAASAAGAPASSDPQGSAAAESPADDTSAGRPAGTSVERRASTLIGMAVVATDGSPLGDVKDIILNRQGQTTHLVISYDAQSGAAAGATSDGGLAASGSGRRLTAMPWDAAMASIKDGRLVLEGAKLHDAPSFTAQAWPDLDDPSWSAASDTYWRKAVRAAIAAHPGTPIDSTTRRRSRTTRDDE